MILYAIDHPNQRDNLLGLRNAYPIPIGKISNYAIQGSDRFGAFRGVYDNLSGFAHPTSRSIFASARPTETGFQWALHPRFKADHDFLVASALVVEMAEANSHLLVEYADAQDWGK